MKLYAISDLHLSHAASAELIARAPAFPDDWLIVAGDVGESISEVERGLQQLVQRFARVLWVPGNHELWTLPNGDGNKRGEYRYRDLVERCRRLGVVTPEDPYPTWPGPPRPHKLVPLFLLYDYSFAPDAIASEADALAWAAEQGLVCADEHYLHPDPYPSRAQWCAARCREAVARLAIEREGLPTVLINHWPLRRDLAVLPRIPRFSIWCGTRATEDWHLRFEASVVVYGHLHIRRSQLRDGVRFEEVSLGYARQYRPERGLEAYLREILPG